MIDLFQDKNKIGFIDDDGILNYGGEGENFPCSYAHINKIFDMNKSILFKHVNNATSGRITLFGNLLGKLKLKDENYQGKTYTFSEENTMKILSYGYSFI